MIRETYTTLQTLAQQGCANDTSAATLTFLQSELNRAKTFIYSDMGDFVTQRTSTTLSVTGQTYYHLPVDCKSIETIKATIGSWDYVLTSTDSQRKWDEWNAMPAPSPAIPTKFLERKRDFGIWPAIQENNDVITIVYQFLDKNMQYSDSTAGTVTVANNSQAVVGSGTAWDQTFVGRWFNVTNDGFDYKITAVTDGTHLTLETSFEGSSGSGLSYTIGDSPDLPEELLPGLAIRAAANYYLFFRKDRAHGQALINYFYTGDPAISATQVNNEEIEPPGGYLAAKRGYAVRTTDSVVHPDRGYEGGSPDPYKDLWGTKVTF